MSMIYRLAVVRAGNGSEVVVEHGGRLLPVDAVLGGKLGRELGAGPADLQPILDGWGKWDALIAHYVDTNLAAFAQGALAAEAEFLPPLAAPGKIACIGSNYHDHIAEMPVPMTPTYPYAFLKPVNNTVRGPGEPVAVPKKVRMMDWEAELGVVIGKICTDVPVADALGVVAGYVNFNDLSARDWLASGPPIGVDWVQHKAFDGFAPFGPYLVPARFVADPQDLPVRLSVNGVMKQDSNTAQMVFGVAAIIAHLTSIMTLYPGDIIATGTPAGVGHGRSEYLKAGDVIRMEVGPLGALVTPIV
jgi:2-keto-4-pentenoate hydratase/2-oxohepta-3-ene-1,7-dioic acid hydratase in catechol pathway